MNWVRMIGVIAPPPVPDSAPEPLVDSASTCGSPKTSAAPIIAPPTEPRPPTMIIARKAIETLMPYVPYSLSSGLRISNHSTVIAPASPAYPEDTANAPALARTTDTPSTDAAASLSRTARQARPGRPREGEAEQAERRRVAAAGGGAGQLRQRLPEVQPDEHQRQRRHAEVDAAQPAGHRRERQPDQRADRHRAEHHVLAGPQPRPGQLQRQDKQHRDRDGDQGPAQQPRPQWTQRVRVGRRRRGARRAGAGGRVGDGVRHVVAPACRTARTAAPPAPPASR